MKKKYFTLSNFLKFCMFLYLFYVCLFLVFHVFPIKLGEIEVSIISNIKDPEVQEVTILSTKSHARYYFLVYEEVEKNNWIYFVHPAYDKYRQTISNRFLPNPTSKYVIWEGNYESGYCTFQMKSKYPFHYIANCTNIFHVIYIVPYRLYPFPTFYFSKHATFTINPIK